MIVKLIAKFWNPPIAAEQLLRVAQLVEDLLVLRGVVPAGAGPLLIPPSFSIETHRWRRYSLALVPFLSSDDTTDSGVPRRIAPCWPSTS